MKYLPLLWRSLFRRKVRTIFTVLAVLVAFTLFGFLVAIEAAFGMGVELAGNERLVLIHKVSLIQLPVSYTHLTLPTIYSVYISVVAASLKKKKQYTTANAD